MYLDASQPIYLAIAQALAGDIQANVLKADDRLPPQRELAQEIGVTVGTVTRAYHEVHKQGLIRGEIGRGTFVAPRLPDPVPLHIDVEHPPGIIDLTCAYPIYSEELDLAAALRRLSERPGIQELLLYQPSEGMMRHRAAGALWIKKMGLDVSPGEVMVTCGAQHANTVIFGLLAKPGETILAEEMTFPNIKSLAAMMRVNLEPVEIDDRGLIPEAFEAACRRNKVRALYCIPTLHNPTTAIMPEKRRRKIAVIAKDYDVAIVEDENYRFLQPDPPPLVSSFARERCFLVGGVSKALAAGLRIGYVVPPPQMHRRLLHNLAATTIMAAGLTAEIAAGWIEDGTVDLSIQNKQREAAARNELVKSILGPYSYTGKKHAYFIWLELPEAWRLNQFVAEAYRRGVAVTPADAFVVGYAPVSNAVRIALSPAKDRSTLERALRIIADLLADPPFHGGCLL